MRRPVAIRWCYRAFPPGFQGSISQHGMLFNGGWRVDNSLGTLQQRQIGLSDSQDRLLMTTTPLFRGASVWTRSAPDNDDAAEQQLSKLRLLDRDTCYAA